MACLEKKKRKEEAEESQISGAGGDRGEGQAEGILGDGMEMWYVLLGAGSIIQSSTALLPDEQISAGS